MSCVLLNGKLTEVRAKAERALLRYGGAAILAGRFLLLAWATCMIGIGWLGGMAFAEKPLLGTALGLPVLSVLAGLHAVVKKRHDAVQC